MTLSRAPEVRPSHVRSQAEAPPGARYGVLFEHAPHGILIADLAGSYLDANGPACRMLGYARDELTGMETSQIVTEKDAPLVEPAPRAPDGHILPAREWHLRRRDGSVFAAEMIATKLPDGNLAVVVRDISEHKRAEERTLSTLRELNDVKAALDEHAIVAITDHKGRITYVNDKFCGISKYSREELLGRDHRVINSGFHSKEFIQGLWQTISAGGVWKGEIKNKAKDGTFYWVDTTIVPYLGKDGRPIQYIAIRADITQRKRFEEALQAANRMKSEFLANMSHELRTPLNGIIGFTEFLFDEKPGPLKPKQKEYLGDVLGSARHLLQLINDVLDLAKVEAGKMELHPEVFPARKAVEEVAAVTNGIAQKRNIAIDIEIETALGEVELDQHKFKQVLYNLLSNAVKFSAPDGRVAIRAHRLDEHRFEVQVEDHGIGIRAEDIARLFTEFEQLDSGTARRFEGTGLGLALTKKIVEFQGGKIGVKSELGQGSVFTVVLPIHPPEAEAP